MNHSACVYRCDFLSGSTVNYDGKTVVVYEKAYDMPFEVDISGGTKWK